MADLLAEIDPRPSFDIVPGRKLEGTVAGLYAALGEDFETAAIESLTLGYEGIQGDRHAGATRRSGSREPWYRRGTEMRNERQLSLVAPDELALVARRMALPAIAPEWIGANFLLEGIPALSMLPAGTLLFFAGGVTVKVDAQNGPCRFAGLKVAQRAGMADPEAGSLLFPKVAKRLRGLVGWVERPGVVCLGETVSVRIPEQWIYCA